MPSEQVLLYIYDLSLGTAQHLSRHIMGRHFEGVWHTSIVVFNKEYYFGPEKIEVCAPGSTLLGRPVQIEVLGNTEISESVFDEYLEELRTNRFRIGTYNIFSHNCNIFSNELSQFLVGKQIPQHILKLPYEAIDCVIERSRISTLMTKIYHVFQR